MPEAVMPSSEVTVSREVQGGVPVFRGTRVPIQILFDYLESGHSVDDFVRQHPTVIRRQALAVLQEMKERFVGAVG